MALDVPASTRVLVVDDNAVNRMLARAMLARLGVEADVVSDAAEALRSLAEREYTLVLMDVGMPGMDGREATQTWRRSGSGATPRSVPVVALTAHVGDAERAACVRAGMDDYLSKPFGLEELTGVCLRWLGAPSTADGGSPAAAARPTR